MRIEKITPIYTEIIPDTLDEGILYISKEYEVAIHLCACGCGEKTVTPLNHPGWNYTDNNGCVTLHPSIGNFSYECKSHYYITRNRIQWLG